MKICALLTGRGGSSLPNKNIIKIAGKPVLSYPCFAASKIKGIKYFFVSSDDPKILKAAGKLGFQKILRPKRLSTSYARHIDVIVHALRKIKKIVSPDIIVILLANSPTIKSSWIKKSIRLLLTNKSATAVVPVKELNDFHPLRSKRIIKGYLKNFISSKKNTSSNRQDLESCYFLCHNFWTIRSDAIFKNKGYQPWKFMGKKVIPLVVRNSIDIHTKEDIYLANYIIKNNLF
jgi:CMP-N-acetylneuraminic acid synthetase